MPTDPKHWLDDSRNVRKVVIALGLACGVSVIANWAHAIHGHFEWEGWFGFHAVFGFVMFFLLVLAGKYLRKILMRPEDYYDR